jgi:hypothetical protein
VDECASTARPKPAAGLNCNSASAPWEISELARQVRFPLEVNGTVVAGYVADFTWKENGNLVVCDVKSPATRADPTFRLKAKLMSACLGIDILVLS